MEIGKKPLISQTNTKKKNNNTNGGEIKLTKIDCFLINIKNKNN
jgi:hypothetical protein